MLGSLGHVTRQLIVHTSPTKRSSDFIAHLEQLDRLFGPQPGRQAKPVVLVEDNGPIHTSKRSLAALAARAHWLTVEWLPKYAPELNDIEPVWRDLKAHHLAHQTFTDVAALDQAIHDAVIDLNRERIPDPLAMPRIFCFRRYPTKAEDARRFTQRSAQLWVDPVFDRRPKRFRKWRGSSSSVGSLFRSESGRLFATRPKPSTTCAVTPREERCSFLDPRRGR